MSDCIFCKIIAGEIPSSKVYEDENVYAFLDIAPINKGHTLVIPKKCCSDIFSAEEDSLVALGPALQKVARAVKEGVGAEGVNIQQSNGKAAGQEVFHLHFHIIPRVSGDGFTHWPGGKYGEGEMGEVLGKIVEKL